SPPIFQIIIRKYLKNGAASGTEWSEPPRKKFGKWLCLSGIFRVPLHKQRPVLKKAGRFIVWL
ncbi:hypothetical protein, partial [Gemmiger formicilis]|uniref:hypothetical protein n=1 Tax=Gemmiger formicilis TaxID=745368 RepID=UPI003CCA9EB8